MKSNLFSSSYSSQIIKSVIFKFGAIFFTFYFVRESVAYLGVDKYPIWAMQLSIINLLLFFDLGLANGLKNKLSRCILENDNRMAKEYISTSYILMALILAFVYSVFFVISGVTDWSAVFNNYNVDPSELKYSIRIIVFFIFFNMIISITNAIATTYEKSQLVSLGQFFTQLLSVITISFFVNYNEQSLIIISTLYGLSICIGSLLVALYFFYSKPEIIPNLKFVKINKNIRSLFSTGLMFLSLQLLFFFIQSNDRFIIAHLLDAKDVTKYDLLAKYFSLLMVLHALINAPLWPIYSKAYLANDYKKIETIFKKLTFLVVIYVLTGLFMLYFSNKLISIWVGQEFKVPLTNALYSLLMYLVLIVFSIFAFFSNGIGKLKVQFYSLLVGVLVNIPLSIFFVKNFSMGIDGVMLATILSMLIFCLFGSGQYISTIRNMKAISSNTL